MAWASICILVWHDRTFVGIKVWYFEGFAGILLWKVVAFVLFSAFAGNHV